MTFYTFLILSFALGVVYLGIPLISFFFNIKYTSDWPLRLTDYCLYGATASWVIAIGTLVIDAVEYIGSQ